MGWRNKISWWARGPIKPTHSATPDEAQLPQVFPANHALRPTANGGGDLWVQVLYNGARIELKSPDFIQKVQIGSNLSKAGFPAMDGADEYTYSSGVST